MIKAPEYIERMIELRLERGRFKMPNATKYEWIKLLTSPECGLTTAEARTFLFESGARGSRVMTWPALYTLSRLYGLGRWAQ
jgi:hypothetical protein